MKIELLDFSGLSKREQAQASNNGSGKEYANYIRITRSDGEVLFCESDAMEPEDCKFTRDLAWIVEALKAVHAIGRKEAQLP